jgi:hypothetical protein
MTDADDVIVLPVPELVRGIYLVPVLDPQPDLAVALLLEHAQGRWPGLLGSLLTELGDRGVPVEMRTAADIPPLPMELLAVMGASEEQLRRASTATHFLIATVQSQAGWTPVHEWITRAIATVLAERLGSDVIDILNYQILDPARAAATLPDADDQIRLADWVWVDYSPDRTGYWCTTTGLRRFGLPELQTLNAPPNVVEAWGQTMTGIAHRLLGAWGEVLSPDRSVAFVQLPAQVRVTADDVAAAYGDPPTRRSTSEASVRLSLEPGLDPDEHSFLTIHPPLTWSGSAGEHMAHVCGAMFGARAGDIRHAQPSESMDEAIAIARSGLTEIRDRFESGALDLRAKLLVKYAMHAEVGTEYLWAYVTSWRDPFRILGTSAVDAVYHPKVRAGRPVVVDTSSVVDWAVQHDSHGIIEGGWTQTALDET